MGSGKSHRPHHKGLVVIASFKLVKGVLLLALAFGMFSLLGSNVQQVVESWIEHFRVDPRNRLAASIIAKAASLDAQKLEALSGLTALYAGIFLVEGVGLFMHKRWAEYLTVIATGSFIPLEVYEIVHRFSLPRLALLFGNVFIVGYLVYVLREKDIGTG